ncbi:MAG: hypothetical protein ACKVT0_15200 [Planctomycetaceae bacterium]
MAVHPADVTCRRRIRCIMSCAVIAAWVLPSSVDRNLDAAEKTARPAERSKPEAPAEVSPAAPSRSQPASVKPLSSDDATITMLSSGTSSKEARAKCIKRIPLDKFSKKNRRQVDDILKEISLFRQLPTYEFATHHDAYQYFSSYPDAAVSIWRVMQISKFEMWQTDKDRYEADAGDGTIGTIDVLYRSPTQNLILCQGEYKTPFLPNPITAKALIHLQSDFRTNDAGQHLVRHRVDLFVSLPSQPVEAAAKIISPLSNVIIDRNFHDVSVFMQMMSLAMAKHPGWVEQTAHRMEGVLPERKKELIDVTAKVYIDGHKQPEIEPVSAETISQPTNNNENRNTPVADQAPQRTRPPKTADRATEPSAK